MATELEDNLRLILNEKTNKIIPENIKAGVNILGVTGNYTSLGKLPTITIGEITTDTPNEPVTLQITDNNGVELLHNDNIYYISASPFYCTVNQNDTFIFKKKLESLSDKILNIHVLSNPYLCDNYNKSDLNLSGTLVESAHNVTGTLDFFEKDGYNALHTSDANTIYYYFSTSIPSYELSFDFYKLDSVPYSRCVTIYTDNSTYEIEIKGSSNAVYWEQELTSSWKQSAWNNLKLIKSSTNNDVKLYINDKLIATRSYSGNMKGFKFNSGSDGNSRFNGLYKNIRVKNNNESLNEPEFTLVDDGVEILNISPSIEEQEIIIPSAAQTAKVSAVTSSIDSDILPENIKAGVNILGVDGVFETVITSEEYDDCLDLTYMIISGEVPTKIDNGLLYSLETYETFNKKVVDTGIPQSSIQSAYTIFIKINPSSWGNYKGIIGYHGENKQGIVGFQYQDGSLVYANKPDSNVNVTMSPFSTNNDHLLIITYENNLLNIYDDDTKIISNASNVDISPYGNIFLGKAHDAENRFFDGKLGLCYIYNRVLSEDEISKMKIYINMKYSEVTT